MICHFEDNVDAMKSSGFKSSNLSNEMNLINSINLTDSTNTANFYSMCYAPFYSVSYEIKRQS